MVVVVGEYITEAPIRGLPVLRDPWVYIHSVGLCKGCHSIGCGGERYGSGLCFCVERSMWRPLAMVGGGVRGMWVVDLSFLGCCVDSRMSQESMLTFVVWPRM